MQSRLFENARRFVKHHFVHVAGEAVNKHDEWYGFWVATENAVDAFSVGCWNSDLGF